jgi:hypothetical protein
MWKYEFEINQRSAVHISGALAVEPKVRTRDFANIKT